MEIHQDKSNDFGDVDQQHGQRLLQQLNWTFAELEQLDDAGQKSIMSDFLALLEKFSAEMGAWSLEERIRLGQSFQQEAIEAFPNNRLIAYALWLAGAWLESGARRSRSAIQAHELISGFASFVQKVTP